MGIRLDLSQLLALFLETLVYGIRVTSYALVVDATDSRNLGAFLTLFIATTSVLSTASTNATHRRQRKFVLPVAAVMLAIATSHLVVDFVRVVEAFIVNINEPGGAVAYYELLSNPLQVAKTVFYVTQTTIGDGMLIWRYYVVYGKKVLITLPLILVLLVNTAAGYVVCWSLSQARPGSTIFHTASSWITTFFVLTMCINVVTTGAIAWRVMASVRLSSATIAGGRGNLIPVLVVLVESGALYSGSVLALLVSYLVGSNGQYPALDLITPLVGVVFLLIILQIRFHVGRDSTFQASTFNAATTSTGLTGNSRIVPPFTTRPIRVEDGDRSINGFPMHHMAVKIRREVDEHRDQGSEFEDVVKVGSVGDEP